MPSIRSLRMHSFATRFELLSADAARAGLNQHQIVMPAEGTIRGAGGLKLHYLEWLTPASPETVLLMLHGGGLHAHTYDVAALLLAERIRCVALDLRGHGDSEWAEPGDYGTAVVADDIDAVVCGLGASNVIVVGHSLGGLAAMVWASRRPAALDGLVTLDVGPTIASEGGQDVAALITQQAAYADLEEAESALATRSGRSEPSAGVVNTLHWHQDRHLTWKHDPSQFRVGGTAIDLGDDLLTLVERIRCPTLVLRGDRSRVFTKAAARELADAIPGAQIHVVADAGHTIQSSNPRALAVRLHEFLDGLGVPQTR